MNYQKTAKEIVLNYANKHIDKTDNVQIWIPRLPNWNVRCDAADAG